MTAVILAAGKGKRMGGSLTKVMAPLLGKPMISHVVSTVQRFSPEQILVVVSPADQDRLENELGDGSIDFVVQPRALGTADALKYCRDRIETRRVMVLCGDVPLIRHRTLSDMIALHQGRGAAATLLSTDLPDPSGYGRIIRNGEGSVQSIIEHKDASPAQRSIREINSGTYIFEAGLLFGLLPDVSPSPTTDEYYLTDVVALMVEKGYRVEALKIDDRNEIMGVNDRLALKRVQDIFRQRLLSAWSGSGAKITHPHMVYAESRVNLAPGSQVSGKVVLKGGTMIGPGSQVGPMVELEDVVVEGNNLIKGTRSRSSS